MPHLVYHATKHLVPAITAVALLKDACHHLACLSDTIRLEDCKARLISYDHYYIEQTVDNVKIDEFVHLEVFLLTGRTVEQHHAITNGMIAFTANMLSKSDLLPFQLTCTVIEMVKEQYAKYSVNGS